MNHFFALPLPLPVRANVEKIAGDWRRLLPPDVHARWYAPDDYHITLKFLGDIMPDRVHELVPAATRIARRTGLFALRLAPVGGFPDLRKPFVLWAGVESSESLSRLVGTLEYMAEQHGIFREGRPYRPHITLARCHAVRHDEEIQVPAKEEQAFD